MLTSLRLSDVRRMAGLRAFRRGEALYEQGHVARPRRRRRQLEAEVLDDGGGHRVEALERSGELRLHCNCPRAADETCEHMVALLLWWLEQGREPTPRADAVGLDDIDRALRRGSKDRLVELLLEFALRDDGMLNALEIEAAAATGKRVDAGRYKQMIRNALSRRFVDYYHTGDYLRNLEGLRDDLDRLLAAGQDGTAHACFTYLLEKALDRYREVEDTDLRFADILGGAIDSYGAALDRSPLAATARASEVFHLIDAADAGFLEPLVRATATALGAAGLGELERLARDRFEAASQVRGPVQPTVSRRKFRQLLKAVARARGDDRAYLALLSDGIESSADHLLAAERLLALGRLDEARRLAEAGLAARPSGDPRLHALLAAIAERAGDPGAAHRHVVEAFERSPSPELFRHAAALGRLLGRWDETRARLLSRLRRERGSPLLLEVLADENRLEEILLAARRGDFGEPLLERVARRAEGEHPAEAAALWKVLVERHAARPSGGERPAAEAMRRLAALSRLLGDERSLATYLRSLRRRFAGRTRLLDQLEAATR